MLFGGNPSWERQPRTVSGRGYNSLCVNRIAQPYAPSFPGEPGLLFLAPNVIRLEDKCETFPMFLQTSSTSATRRPDRKTLFRYLGTYTKVPITRTTLELDEWLSLPMGCRTAWLQRLLTSTDSDIRAIHARVSIRNKRRHGPPPSLDETEEWLKNNPGRRQGIKIVPLRAAFESET